VGRLDGKVALITGGARGIGRTTALLFAQEGAKVAVCDVDEAAGLDLVKAIEQQGGEALFVRADVAQMPEVERTVAQIKERWGRIDVLLNNAGILRDATLLKLSEEDFDAVIDVNLKGVFHCTKAVAPLMVEQGQGSIINVSSVVALYGNFGQTNYVAAKAGILGMTKVWARELGRKGIRVNAVCPGFVETEMIRSVPPEILEKVKERIPLGRFASPEEIARVYLFLASDESSYLNGAVISADGGMVV